MFIIPMACRFAGAEQKERIEKTHKASRITHGHPRSQMACGFYVELAVKLIKGMDLRKAYEETKQEAVEIYREHPYKGELPKFSRIMEQDIAGLSRGEIKSTGYVIDTLEAALWCMLTTGSYKDAVLAAVNLGNDSDTTGAVTGGLAGIYYGFESIPRGWIEKIALKDKINDLAARLEKANAPADAVSSASGKTGTVSRRKK